MQMKGRGTPFRKTTVKKEPKSETKREADTKFQLSRRTAYKHSPHPQVKLQSFRTRPKVPTKVFSHYRRNDLQSQQIVSLKESFSFS